MVIQDLVPKLFQYGIPAIFGFLGGILAIYMNYFKDRWMDRSNNRKEFLREVRAILLKRPPVRDFVANPMYSQVKQLLSKELVEKISSYSREDVVVIISGCREVNPYVDDVLDELAKKERTWGLM